MAVAEFDLLPIIDQACIAMSRSETTSAQKSTLGPASVCLRQAPSACPYGTDMYNTEYVRSIHSLSLTSILRLQAVVSD